jgi:hypothetical protein
MPKALKRVVGFGHPTGRATKVKRRPIAIVELITTAALALSTVVAVTAVSIGMARADLPSAAADAGALTAMLRLIGLS